MLSSTTPLKCVSELLPAILYIGQSLIKVKFSTSRYKKSVKQKRCGIICLNVPNFFIFWKKSSLKWKKGKKPTIIGLLWILQLFHSFLHFFHSKIDFFWKIKKIGTFKHIIPHLFCFTLFFVSWSWKFDFYKWLAKIQNGR